VGETPDVTIVLTVDQYVRLIAGWLALGWVLENGTVAMEGARETAPGLARIFRGIGGAS